MAEPQNSKRCICCDRVRSVGEFFVSKFTVDGRTDTCRPCILARAAEYRAGSEARAARRQPHCVQRTKELTR